MVISVICLSCSDFDEPEVGGIVFAVIKRVAVLPDTAFRLSCRQINLIMVAVLMRDKYQIRRFVISVSRKRVDIYDISVFCCDS